jgi:hypothetical protein
MFAKMAIAFSVATVLSSVSAAHAGGLPSVDIERMCRASAEAPFADNTAIFDICLGDEQAAHEQLARDWAILSAADKARCVLPAEYLPSYVEWLTCLEMEAQLRRMRESGIVSR